MKLWGFTGNGVLARMLMGSLILALGTTCLLFCGCQGLPGRKQSPGTEGGSSTATQVQGAQTIGRDQGQAETPQTVTTGTATVAWNFASEVDAAVLSELVALAKEQKWKPAELLEALKALNGAPENVTITTADVYAESGDGDQAGASGGTGGAAQNAPPNPDRP